MPHVDPPRRRVRDVVRDACPVPLTNMDNMFRGATSFNQPLNNWNVSNVGDMGDMFLDARSFNQPLHAPWYDSR